MTTERTLEWARWGAVLLCVATGLVAAAEDELTQGVSGLLPGPALLALSGFYAALLFALLRPFPGETPGRKRWLMVLMGLSLPLDYNALAAFNLFALPFVVRRNRGPWFWAQGGIFTFQLAVAWLNLVDPVQRSRLVRAFGEEPGLLLGSLGLGILQMAAWGGFAYLVGSLLVQLETDRRRLVQANAELQSAQTLLAETARVEERLRISRELHDSVGHYLTSMGLQLEILDSLAGPECRPSLERAQLLVRLLLAEVRDAAGSCRLERSATLPFAIRQLLEGAQGLQVELDLDPDLPSDHPGTTHALYRCVQEALTNVLRHASARSMTITLKHFDEAFQLAVHDDGTGRAEVAWGAGLRGMEERVRALGGSLSVASSPGQGFSVRVCVPSRRNLA